MRHRQDLIQALNLGRIAPEDLAQAVNISGLRPDRRAWLHFAQRLLGALGLGLWIAAVIFFFAANWSAMPVWSRFALLEGLFIISLLLIGFGSDWWQQAGLIAAFFMVGALLALIGQTYQTGADAWQLFATWALFTFPWTLINRQLLLWLFWLILINISLYLYQSSYSTFDAFSLDYLKIAAWLNTFIWLVAEWRLSHDHPWSHYFISFWLSISAYAVNAWLMLDLSIPALSLWGAWLIIVYYLYRYRSIDRYALSLFAAAIIFLTGRLFADQMETTTAYLFLAAILIAMSTIAAHWLKNLKD